MSIRASSEGEPLAAALIRVLPSCKSVRRYHSSTTAMSFATSQVGKVLEEFPWSKAIMDQYPAFLPMMACVCLNKLRLGVAVPTELDELTVAEGISIGTSLAGKHTHTHTSGLDQGGRERLSACEK